MKLYRMITLVAVVMMAMTGMAQQATMKVDAVASPWTVTVTALSDDIVRVDVVPNEWNGTKLPTLACDKALNGRVPKVKINEGAQVSTMVTENGLSVRVFNSMGLIKVGRGDNDYLVDVLPMRDSSKVVLVHNAGESFYGAGERGYSFNLAGDTLVNYNTQNYGYQMGEKRTKLMGITVPMVISSKGYGVLFDDFCKSSLVLGSQQLEYTSTTPQPISYYIIDGNGLVENVVKNFTWLVGRQELPPLWTLGYITSKYGYHDQRESEGVVDTLKRECYPLDGIVFDLYWYGKEEDMGRLAWDQQQWPDHRKMLRDFKEKGVNVVTISQPYVLTNGRAIDNYRLLDPQGLFCKTDGTDTTHTVTIWVG